MVQLCAGLPFAIALRIVQCGSWAVIRDSKVQLGEGSTVHSYIARDQHQASAFDAETFAGDSRGQGRLSFYPMKLHAIKVAYKEPRRQFVIAPQMKVPHKYTACQVFPQPMLLAIPSAH
jgi:hypothetical protein